MKQVNIKPEMIANWNDLSTEAHRLKSKNIITPVLKGITNTIPL